MALPYVTASQSNVLVSKLENLDDRITNLEEGGVSSSNIFCIGLDITNLPENTDPQSPEDMILPEGYIDNEAFLTFVEKAKVNGGLVSISLYDEEYIYGTFIVPFSWFMEPSESGPILSDILSLIDNTTFTNKTTKVELFTLGLIFKYNDDEDQFKHKFMYSFEWGK